MFQYPDNHSRNQTGDISDSDLLLEHVKMFKKNQQQKAEILPTLNTNNMRQWGEHIFLLGFFVVFFSNKGPQFLTKMSESQELIEVACLVTGTICIVRLKTKKELGLAQSVTAL